jgi:hypothetical protein
MMPARRFAISSCMRITYQSNGGDLVARAPELGYDDVGGAGLR